MTLPANLLLSRRRGRIEVRPGFTLIELLIATVMTLMVMAATVTMFGMVGDRITSSRAVLEMGDRIRSAQQKLRRDIKNLTLSPVPWARPEAAPGYLEILKGPARDSSPVTKSTSWATLVGYTEDAIFLTTRSKDLPFVGNYLDPNTGNQTTIESQVAEVVWFMLPTVASIDSTGHYVFASNPPTFNLYRRVLLVRPDLPPTPLFATGTTNYTASSLYYDLYDLSAHLETINTIPYMVPNSLADLAYRDNRFRHIDSHAVNTFAAASSFLTVPSNTVTYQSGITTPQSVLTLGDSIATNPQSPLNFPLNSSPRAGEDVVLSNVLSFDIKVWDPLAGVEVINGVTLVPGDYGYVYTLAAMNSSGIRGAYVDLNYLNGTANASYFSGQYYGQGSRIAKLTTTATNNYATYDTGSAGSETLYASTATNGFDNDNANGVGDPNERVTSPPYPVPLRGIQIKIRTYEPISRQVRETTVVESFLND